MRSSTTSFNAVLLCRFTASVYVLRLFSATRSARSVLPSRFFWLHVSRRSSGWLHDLNRSLMCCHPIIVFLNSLNNDPWTGFEKKSAGICDVGQYCTSMFPFLILSVTQKYFTAICFEFQVHESRPLFNSLISDSLSLQSTFLFNLHPCPSKNISK